MSRTILAGIITATFIAGAAAPAFADPAHRVRSVDVDISGYDLGTENGARMVLKRLEKAADSVCGVRSGVKTLQQLRYERACINDAMENAIDSIGGDPERKVAVRRVWKG
ncbi:UrcA family protein [Henriciella aquimarina]|uniref:UrcA family protein n=1 Tax=Henriciella aquimarina TaxID=545261 RepID=UPI000A04DCE6|nr:UrcA family protein [Henriciella aquimarina]